MFGTLVSLQLPGTPGSIPEPAVAVAPEPGKIVPALTEIPEAKFQLGETLPSCAHQDCYLCVTHMCRFAFVIQLRLIRVYRIVLFCCCHPFLLY